VRGRRRRRRKKKRKSGGEEQEEGTVGGGGGRGVEGVLRISRTTVVVITFLSKPPERLHLEN